MTERQQFETCLNYKSNCDTINKGGREGGEHQIYIDFQVRSQASKGQRVLDGGYNNNMSSKAGWGGGNKAPQNSHKLLQPPWAH